MKKAILLLLILALTLSAAACGAKKPEGPTQVTPVPKPTQAPAPNPVTQPAVQTLSLSVDGATGEMTIQRPEPHTMQSMGDANTWTIFVYLCGADLESDVYYGMGMATEDVKEMCAATESEKVRFVVQTGGANYWYAEEVDPQRSQRFVIEGGGMQLVSDNPRSGMGKPGTLSDFLRWGVEEYGAEHMGLIFWDHGGGSISGVCFDEQEHNDSLSLREIDAALLSVYRSMTDRFEFIGFDACLMGTVEAANILATYADYMVASEELEPGSGWDYTAIGDFLAAHPQADGGVLGRKIADSFLQSCRAMDCDDGATMSVVDLRKIDALLESFNRFAAKMFAACEAPDALADMARAIYAADNFGGNNRLEGYTNMVDLGGIVEACAPYAEGGDEVLSALEEAVVYKVSGSDHRGTASGLSMYFPLQVQGSTELRIFADICVSPYYLSFVDKQAHGSVNAGDSSDYDRDTWFEDGDWSWNDSYDYDGDADDFSFESDDGGYFDYADDYSVTGASPLITFDVEPALDEDGIYSFVLSDEGWMNAVSVNAYVYQVSPDGEDLIELGETVDVYCDWDYGYFEDDFDGYWLALPDGQDLATYIVEITDDCVIYSSPVYLNGEETFLRMRQGWDGIVTVDGTWAGISDSGAAGRDVIPLQAGDVICPRYYAYEIDTDYEGYYYSGVDYTVGDTLDILYDFMDEGDYLYSFCINDIYGDYYMTEFVMFNIEDGEIYFYLD